MPQLADSEEVFNQSPPYVDVDLYASDRPLQEAVAANGGATQAVALGEFGCSWGAAGMFDLAREANENPPRLRRFDPRGYRLDQVEFHPAYHRFMADPAAHGYPGGESFADVYVRAAQALEGLLELHRGQAVLVVSHHVVNRTYLAGLLGLAPGQARQVTLDNCGISVVVRDGAQTLVCTLNAAFHLQGVAA